MNKFIAGCAAVAAATAGSFAVAGDTGGFTVAPMIGYYGFDREVQREDDGFLSLGLGYQFDNAWGVEFTYLVGEANTEVGNFDTDFESYRLDALYHLDRSGAAQPYLAFGAGHFDEEVDAIDSHSGVSQINAGIGLKYYLTQQLALRGDLRFFNNVDIETVDIATSFGVTYLIGGNGYADSKPAPVVVAAPVDGDADGDGVADSIDRCPNTPAGSQVDASGCIADDDKDGVPNANDQCPNTSAGAKVDAKGCYIVLKETRTMNLSVNFASGSDVVPVAYYDEVAKVANFMRQFPLTKLVVEGHTDSSGGAAFNQSLSEKRARAVANLLVSKFGIDATRVSSVGYGEARPVASNDNPEGRATNRRVVAVISAIVEKVAQ